MNPLPLKVNISDAWLRASDPPSLDSVARPTAGDSSYSDEAAFEYVEQEIPDWVVDAAHEEWGQEREETVLRAMRERLGTGLSPELEAAGGFS